MKRYAVNLVLTEDIVGIEKYDVVDMIMLMMTARGVKVEQLLVEEVKG